MTGSPGAPGRSPAGEPGRLSAAVIPAGRGSRGGGEAARAAGVAGRTEDAAGPSPRGTFGRGPTSTTATPESPAEDTLSRHVDKPAESR